MRVAVLVKQVPRAETLELGPDGRLRRDGIELDMNAYCRRAVSKGVELARTEAGTCTVMTLGPESAEDVLREAVAWGADRGILITDQAFAGSDTLATARALAAALKRTGPWDLVLMGRNSVDADTGQVGPELAQLLDLPFVAGAKEIALTGRTMEIRCELDDGWRRVEVDLPAIVSAAERLIEPCKVPPVGRSQVDPERISRLRASDLGAGPWGAEGSPTRVGAVRLAATDRRGIRLQGPVDEQVDRALALLVEWGALQEGSRTEPGSRGSGEPVPAVGPGSPIGGRTGSVSAEPDVDPVRAFVPGSGPVVVVIVEPGRRRIARELLGEAALLAADMGGSVVAFVPELTVAWPVNAQSADFDSGSAEELGTWSADELGSWGADRYVAVKGCGGSEEEVAAALIGWSRRSLPWVVLAPGTLWGREVAGRTAAALSAGLTGDAVGFGVEGGRLVGWKPAFGGRLVAAVTASSAVQMATVRPGILPRRPPRPLVGELDVEEVTGVAGRVAGDRCDDLAYGGGEASAEGSLKASAGAVSRALAGGGGTRAEGGDGRSRPRVRVMDEGRDDEVGVLPAAGRVVAVGQGVAPEDYEELQPLLGILGAELGATRNVTDRGWLPRARQIGLTGHSLDPALFVSIGSSGKYNHMVGVQGAGVVLAINNDPEAPIFEHSDVGIVGDWHQVVKALVARLA